MNLTPLSPADYDRLAASLNGAAIYSDFNFVSLWCWDTDGQTAIGELGDSLVIRFIDYLSGLPFLSFSAGTDPDAVAAALISMAEGLGCPTYLDLVPEATAKRLDPTRWLVFENRDQADYILDPHANSRLSGVRFRSRRRACNRFDHEFGPHATVKHQTLREFVEQRGVSFADLTKPWLHGPDPESRELPALSRIDDVARLPVELHVITIDVDSELKGFSILELTTSSTALVHFSKADRSMPGIYSCLAREEARLALNLGVQHLNIEQDLGLAGLRASKLSERPTDFLRKYRVEPR